MVNESKTEASGKSGSYETLAIFAWIAVATLFVNVSFFVGGEVGGEIFRSGADLGSILRSFSIGMLKAGPTIFIALALIDFAFFFSRCSKGDIFTRKNLKTLRDGADSLIWAAVTSAVVIPIVMDFAGIEDGYRILRFTDLALGVGLMGIALHGLSSVFSDAVALKDDNDQFV